MKISLIDRSLYYKGLMLLIRKDHEISDEERSIMMRIGEILGFESEFCSSTIEEIIDNKYVDDSAPVFSEPSIAFCFIRDGITLSASDGQIHKTEIEWLKSVAEMNDLDTDWGGELERRNLTNCTESLENSLEMKHFEWE
jgi:hypothetical protein